MSVGLEKLYLTFLICLISASVGSQDLPLNSGADAGQWAGRPSQQFSTTLPSGKVVDPVSRATQKEKLFVEKSMTAKREPIRQIVLFHINSFVLPPSPSFCILDEPSSVTTTPFPI